MRRVLLGTGPSPWSALADLAEAMKSDRRSDACVLRATQDVQMRMMRVDDLVAGGTSWARWIVEATWEAG